MERIGDLVIRARSAPTWSGRVDAYGRLVERFRDMACGYAYSVVGDFHLAEDVAQEAFIVAFDKLGQLQDFDAFPGWFRRIVWSECGRTTRRASFRLAGLEAVADISAGGPGPDQIVEQMDMKDHVLRAIQGLPPPEREATTLFYINGYSQNDIAEFLEVPVDTVKNRLRASRSRLKERMLNMVKDTLHQNAPDERFNQAVIDELLSRPRPLEMPGHPSRQALEAIRAALGEYKVIGSGSEVEDERTARQGGDSLWSDATYRTGDKGLRTSMSSVTMTAIAGLRPPVRLLAAGRVFRPIRSAAHRAKVFHQLDGVCIEPGADVAAFKATCERAIRAAVPGCAITWLDYTHNLVNPGFSATAEAHGLTLEILGGGMLTPQTLLEKGYDPHRVAGFGWGLSLDRLAMLRLGIADIQALWKPPYIL
ncbi:MAG: sigma-70 family RNA polymerase sigma factor [Phycisphaerae bacterium]|nr:sigma-70 family RNA polymerase sigma factor [Phycisphaerae bacterium]